jgi:hypothetical protein
MKRLRDAPTSNGYPNSVNWSKALSSCRLCLTVFPNPIPGSMAIRSPAISADPANSARSCRNARTSPITSAYCGSLLHGGRCAAHVHEHHACTVFGDHFGHPCIVAQGAHIVDDPRARRQPGFRHFGQARVQRDPRLIVAAAQRCDNRNRPVDLLARRYRFGSGSGGFGTDVDDVRTLSQHGFRPGQRPRGIVVGPAVAERIGRDIENSHDRGPIRRDRPE